MHEFFNNNINVVYIRTIGMKIKRDEADARGIIKCMNSVSHKDAFSLGKNGTWSMDLVNDPKNLMLNRLEGDIVISSMVLFRDEFSMNLFVLKHLYTEMEGGMKILNKCFVN
jgi:hypothetical protein